MKLAEYISDLLYRYDCVIVPDFGGFVANTKPASISSANILYPPTKEISFNSLLKINDGLLANHIANVDKMPYESALNYLKFEVNQWKEVLEENDLDLENIGTLSLLKDRIVFEPEKKVNYLTDSYGLSSVVANEIKREVYIKQVEKLQEKSPIVITPEARKSKRNYLKYAAIFVLGLGLLSAGAYAYKNYQYNQELATAKKQQKITEDKIQQATFIVSEPLPSILLDVTRTRYPYHVIAGAFRFPENADKMVNILKSKGFDNARVLGINQWGLTQVSFDSYSDRDEAVNSLRNVQSSQDREAWLLVQDL